MPTIAKSTRKAALFTDISERDRASKRPSIDPAGEGPYNLTLGRDGLIADGQRVKAGEEKPISAA